MSRELEFEELLYYVVELKDKLNTKLDAQTVKINQQGTIINQQGQIVDELCWQLRELSEKVRDLRAENRRLRERMDKFCPNCAGCHCGVSTYENHIVDQYNELLGDNGGKKMASTTSTTTTTSSPPTTISRTSFVIAKSETGVETSIEGHDDQQKQQQDNRQTYQKIDEYTEVVKKSDPNGNAKKKWLFGSKKDQSVTSVTSTDSKTIWYIDDESIYEPIELSAKPTTRAQLEKISAEVSSTAPKPAPRRLYAAPAVDNLAQYFHDGSDSLCEIEEIDEEEYHHREEDVGENRESDDVMLRPAARLKQFGATDSQRGSSVVAYSRIADLDLSHLPEEESISSENIVRFTVNSRPATVQPRSNNDKEATDTRRHAIHSYI